MPENKKLDETRARYGPRMSSSGRSHESEYLRTIGAFFALYWLMRIGIDGKDGFVRGVDENWGPLPRAAAAQPTTG